MDAEMQPELTLIVAATRSMGIGFRGGLPWKGLRKEMQYFARVTQRPASPASTALNAVIMGRKTWDSIPASFRPLKNRLNIVVSRSAAPPTTPAPPPSAGLEIRVPSVEDAVRYARERCASRIFVIGGAAIYRAALEMQAASAAAVSANANPNANANANPNANADGDTNAIETTQPRTRILLTSIEDDFECDVFFPLDPSTAAGWRRCGAGEMSEWTGEEDVQGGREEAGVHYEFQMWERE